MGTAPQNPSAMLKTLKVVDLADQSIAAEGERWIARELLPGTYGISSEEYFI